MISFFFKKNFYDGWDNVISFFIPNLICNAVLLLGGGFFFLGTKLNGTAGLTVWIVTFAIVLIMCSILALAWAESARELADYEISGFKEFFAHLKTSIFDGIRYGLIIFAVAIITICGIIYYFRLTPGQFKKTAPTAIEEEFVDLLAPAKTTQTDEVTIENSGEPSAETSTLPPKQDLPFIGLLTGCVFCWIALSVFSALFWYPILRATYHNKFSKTLKKCFVLMLDNLGKNAILMFYNFFLLLVSVIMLGLAPGLAGIGMSRANFLRLLLKKYDYLEELEKDKEKLAENPHRKIPWKEILSEDVEITGSRNFKSFFMPWKE